MRPLLSVCLAALTLVGCAHRPAMVSAVDCASARDEARRLHDLWQGHNVTGTAQVTARDGLLRSRANVTLAVAPPDRLRLEVSDDFGQTLLVALVNGTDVAFWNPTDGWLTGAPAVAAVPLPPVVWPDLPRLLVAMPCGDPACSSSVTRADDDTVLLTCGHEPVRWRWHPERRRVVGAHLPSLWVSYLDSERVNGLHPPDLDVVTGEGRSLTLRWQQFRLDRDLPTTLFQPPRPKTAPTPVPSTTHP
jgi:hypothetical protein